MNGHPMIGNLAWAPLPAFEEVEVLDRFNGVPSLGIFGQPGSRILFWRAFGYVQSTDLSIWLYVPLSPADEERLAAAEGSDMLDGLIFQSAERRSVTVGFADEYRLVAEFEWTLPEGLASRALIREMLLFLMTSLAGLSEQESVAPSRRRAARKASKAVRALVPA